MRITKEYNPELTIKENMSILSKNLKTTYDQGIEDDTYDIEAMTDHFLRHLDGTSSYVGVKNKLFITLASYKHQSLKICLNISMKITKSTWGYNQKALYGLNFPKNTSEDYDTTIEPLLDAIKTRTDKEIADRLKKEIYTTQSLADTLEKYDMPLSVYKDLVSEFSYGTVNRFDMMTLVTYFPEEAI